MGIVIGAEFDEIKGLCLVSRPKKVCLRIFFEKCNNFFLQINYLKVQILRILLYFFKIKYLKM